MDTALVLVDIQNDYFEGGRNELFNPLEAAGQAGRVLSAFRDAGLPVFHVQHISLGENASFFLPGTEGCKIHERVYPRGDEAVVVKHTPDSFFQTELKELLDAAGVKRLVVCGMMSHMCIDTTARSAKRLGYEVVLLHEACTTKDLTWQNTVIPAATVHKTFMASLQGTFAKVTDTESFFEDMRDLLR